MRRTRLVVASAIACAVYLNAAGDPVARGSGSYVTLGDGKRIYLPATQEARGWLTDISTNSIRPWLARHSAPE